MTGFLGWVGSFTMWTRSDRVKKYVSLGYPGVHNYRHSYQSCASTNWWSAVALGGLMTGGAPRIFHRRRRRGFIVGGGGVGGVRPDERALKTAHSPDRRFFLVLQVSATSPVISAGADKLTVNMHAVHNFTVLVS